MTYRSSGTKEERGYGQSGQASVDRSPPLVAARANSSTDLKESIERGFVLLTFTNTRGGTELGVELDKEARCWVKPISPKVKA